MTSLQHLSNPPKKHSSDAMLYPKNKKHICNANVLFWYVLTEKMPMDFRSERSLQEFK